MQLKINQINMALVQANKSIQQMKSEVESLEQKK